MNGKIVYPQTDRLANQLATLEHVGLLQLPAPVEDLPAYAGLDQAHVPVAYRAKSYLHSNCSGCHRPGEATQAPMDFRFATPTPQMNACDVTPVFGTLGVPNSSPAGVVAAYGFEDGVVATDASGNGNNGVISGAAWTPAGRLGGALSFDGIDDRVTVPDAASLDLTSGMTLEAWVQPTAAAANDWRTVILKEAGNDLAYALYASGPAGPPEGYVTGGGTTGVTGSDSLPLGTWTHLALTYDGTALRLYRNGVAIGTQNRTGAIATSTNPLQIGGNAVWGEYFRGLIDEVRVYNRALAPAEIAAAMARVDLPPDAVTDAKILKPGSPLASVMWLRDGTREPLVQMPPLATSIVHDEWVALAAQWIADPTVCDAHGDTDGDGVTDDVDNCPAVANASQQDEDRDGVGRACDVETPDSDGDGVADSSDNCPYEPNPTQSDVGGIGTAGPDGLGDACQCGDVNNDGTVTSSDATVLSRALINLSPAFSVGGNAVCTGGGTPVSCCSGPGTGSCDPGLGVAGLSKCNVAATPTPGVAGCTSSDATVVSRALVSLAPGIAQGCDAAQP